MTSNERWAEIEIEFAYDPDEFADGGAFDDLFDAVADLIHSWADERGIDPFVSARFNCPIPEWLSETGDPPTDPLAREADPVSTPMDWRDMFVRYAKTVGEMEGVDFLCDGEWTQEEWDAIWDLHAERFPEHADWVERARRSPRFRPVGESND